MGLETAESAISCLLPHGREAVRARGNDCAAPPSRCRTVPPCASSSHGTESTQDCMDHQACSRVGRRRPSQPSAVLMMSKQRRRRWHRSRSKDARLRLQDKASVALGAMHRASICLHTGIGPTNGAIAAPHGATLCRCRRVHSMLMALRPMRLHLRDRARYSRNDPRRRQEL